MDENKLISKPNFIFYTSDDGDVKLEVFLEDETIWLTQKLIAELFNVSIPTINIHINNIFGSGELKEDQTIRKYQIVQKEGGNRVSRDVKYYNLDVIIAVGYRVNSKRATQFRIWATKILKEYLIKGFALDDNRLKQGEKTFGKDFFKELLERIRSIRASERRIYLQITDIFAECSIDYDPNSETTKNFYAMVQNKFHFAITGKTAAEIIYESADNNKPYMGLKTWKNSPDGRILKSDALVGKNYLDEKQIKRLERTISSFFDYIENLIENRTLLSMGDMAKSVNEFLNFNKFQVLEGKGKISQKLAERKAKNEYEEFNKNQIINSDFEKEIKRMLVNGSVK